MEPKAIPFQEWTGIYVFGQYRPEAQPYECSKAWRHENENQQLP
ncbi:hypothetical protein [Occallatibacter savannae]|nr:hypothetical protein [Occallatibacter savannae]